MCQVVTADDRSLASADEKHGLQIHTVAAGGSSVNLPSIPHPAHLREMDGGTRGQPLGGAPEEDEDDTVITLKKCHHSFHSRCLTSWFLTNRYDCPICRTVFWGNGRPYATREREQQARGTGAVLHEEDPDRVFWEAMIF